MLYFTFNGNQHTRRGIQEEAMTIREYKLLKNSEGITNLLHSKPINLTEASKDKVVKDFCLEYVEHKNILQLKRTHSYFQIQGQLNVLKLPWLDFVLSTLNPYQLHVERIVREENLWNKMVPKLSAFYHKALLPELAAPRLNTLSGIRKPGIWCKRVNTLTETREICDSKIKKQNEHSVIYFLYKETQSYCKRGSEVTTTVKQDNRHQVNPPQFSLTLKAEHKDSASKCNKAVKGKTSVKKDISTNKPCTTSCESKGDNKDKQEKTSTSAPNCSSAQQTLAHTRRRVSII
ncbi:hypothetical protein KUTeg_011348 [Tegillarca granosa]|uniref:Uncharacterized protein n=1 Tax=Tegillarca granosa TaxID=220873 RepID=A0ABQ9F672_TEGGR|nr:hypothetical protein KUTeg_011348 [Tegillarca granosa]